MTDPNSDRIGTHWATCWRDGGRRHYACAVAEAERQIARAEAAEVQLAAVLPDFYSEVCAEAERIMASSGMVSGAHWNAMRIVLERRGVQPEVQS